MIRLITLPPRGWELVGYLAVGAVFAYAFAQGPRRAPRYLVHGAGLYFFLEIARSLHRGVESWQFLLLGPWIPALYVLAAFAHPVAAAWRYSLIWTLLLYGMVSWGLERREGSAILAYVATALVGQLTVASLIILLARFREMYGQTRFWREQALTCALTGLPNRRAFELALAREISRAERYGTPFSLVLVDLDHFKRINDTLGHDYGDELLRRVARLLVDQVRREDVVARWGGEEFALLLPSTRAEDAQRIAERLRQVLQAQNLGLTASFGVAEYVLGEEEDSLFRRADQALYRAKDAGRNRVEVAE
ncbi:MULTISPECIES: GGDEF domain-containing protein [Thermus]|uniref:GGDEF domain-containing protein n=1 Tax=Thermus TaxID=270 RepID=UPI002DD425C4|nr:GGDEF domain-containing protein [Thermus brockianus]